MTLADLWCIVRVLGLFSRVTMAKCNARSLALMLVNDSSDTAHSKSVIDRSMTFWLWTSDLWQCVINNMVHDNVTISELRKRIIDRM